MTTATAEIESGVSSVQEYLNDLRALAIDGLARMYLPKEQMYCHCIRRGPNGDVAEGVSRRYTAITLVGLATESNAIQTKCLLDQSVERVCSRLLSDIDAVENLGDVALTLWAAYLLQHAEADKALRRLKALDPVRGPFPTVEVAWSLTALSVAPEFKHEEGLARQIALRLIRSQSPSGVFPHYPNGVAKPLLRGHVACFADMVYPTQALSRFHAVTCDTEAANAAKRGGGHMVKAQGRDGQWGWHFDARSGRVVEGYPVYSVHQDSMAPMALLDLEDACGVDSRKAIEKGLDWLRSSPEIDGKSLVEVDAGLIWRKVARHEPGKLVRGVQAAASRLHPAIRAPGVDLLFQPGFIDYESRPYHLGWILHAFTTQRVAGWIESRGVA